MPTNTWKKVELAIAALMGGERRGADFRGRTGGKSDIIMDGYSAEVKHSKRPTYGLIAAAVAQARDAKENTDDLPLAVIHKEGARYTDSLVVIHLEDFIALVMPRLKK